MWARWAAIDRIARNPRNPRGGAALALKIMRFGLSSRPWLTFLPTVLPGIDPNPTARYHRGTLDASAQLPNSIRPATFTFTVAAVKIVVLSTTSCSSSFLMIRIALLSIVSRYAVATGLSITSVTYSS